MIHRDSRCVFECYEAARSLHVMLLRYIKFILCLVAALGVSCEFSYDDEHCEIITRVHSGRICGTVRRAENGAKYASFLGIPYATQPLGELRFQELKPVEPWYHLLNATKEGPVCPQHDIVWGDLITPHQGMSEACIYGNVHVPLEINYGYERRSYHQVSKSGLPILVFVHGGGFLSGSGDTDIYGPENLIGKGVIVITFNYRINVFGFLSLNTPAVPGNQGLRDILTFLRWVQKNAHVFGGDADNVTLMGQSAGAASAHLIALSRHSEGLFKRLILQSGSAISGFYTASPIYAKLVATLFLSQLGINSTDLNLVHEQLTKVPLENILKANSIVQYITGLVSFLPVVESPFTGVERVVDDDPLKLIKKGRDKEYPIILGFTSNECEFFKPRIEYIDFVGRIEANPLLILDPNIAFSTPPNVALQLAQKVLDRYFHGKPSVEKYLPACADTFFKYPAFKLAELRSGMEESAPVYLYQFTYEAELSVVKKALFLEYKGVAHVEDLTYVFRTNSVLGSRGSLPPRDQMMKEWMRMVVVNFMKCGNPTCTSGPMSPWPAVKEHLLNYQKIDHPGVFSNSGPTGYERDTIDFFKMIEARSKNATLQLGEVTEDSVDIAGLVANMTSASQIDVTRRLVYYVTYKKGKH